MATTVWKGYISFALVSIPVRLYTGARGKIVAFHLLHKTDNSRIHEVMYCDAQEHRGHAERDQEGDARY
jgi:DNA end-binding protein Ku